MNGTTKKEAFHQRLSLLIGTEEPFRWAKRMGIPSATFARIWNNHDIPKHDHLCRIAQRCKVSLDWLLLGSGEESCSRTSFAGMPLIGFANCGIAQGWFNESDLSHYILLPSFLSEEGAFAVLCRGKSMMPAGIYDGDVCLVYPNRPIEFGKPALIRTKTFIKGKEETLTTIKLIDSEDSESLLLSGWLDPDEKGEQSLFTEKRLKNCITMMAPVGNVVPVGDCEKVIGKGGQIDRAVLLQCLEVLHSIFETVDSENFADMVLFLYEEIEKKGRPDMETLKHLTKIFKETRAYDKNM